eukprot:3857701-Amphidinium_carterae.2
MSFALVSHHNVEWHVDRMNNAHSYVVTINGTRAFLEVETDVRCMRRSVCTSDRVVYFDATRRHRVNVPGNLYAKSIVMVECIRSLNRSRLFEPTWRTPTPSKRLARGEDEGLVAERATKARSSNEDGSYEPHDDEPQGRRGDEDILLSPTLAWETQDGYDAGAGGDVKAERDEMSRLIQWTRGLACCHSAKQLRLILMGEKKTLKKLTTCKSENDRAKADVLIRVAMTRCGMKPGNSGAGNAQAAEDGGKGRARSQPPVRGNPSAEGSVARSSSQPAEGRTKGGKGGKDKGKGKESNKGSGKGSKPPVFKLVSTEWPAEAWKPEQPGVYLSEDAADVVKWAAQCRFARVPILAVTPCKPDLVNYPVHRRVLIFAFHILMCVFRTFV